ncbi:MAG: hypothetical protein NW900_02475, partial [Candidatus Blochmannia sp. A2]|nr:hypothetical protein [Candidatus Phytoplasma australiense]MBZ7920157.1 hypothetical protein [Candidatus Karelsulcia muelleri]MCG7202179.1 hypothetical protein [Candidatus Phytoplasma mali]MDE5285041.1 hypothetical protein [Candidatus Blochmannia sp. A2]
CDFHRVLTEPLGKLCRDQDLSTFYNVHFSIIFIKIIDKLYIYIYIYIFYFLREGKTLLSIF